MLPQCMDLVLLIFASNTDFKKTSIKLLTPFLVSFDFILVFTFAQKVAGLNQSFDVLNHYLTDLLNLVLCKYI